MVFELQLALEVVSELFMILLKLFWWYLAPVYHNLVLTPYEGCVESNPEQFRWRKSSFILKLYHDIAVKLYFPWYWEFDLSLLFKVESDLVFIISIVVQFLLLESVNSVDFIERFVEPIWKCGSYWDILNYYFLQVLYLWRFDHSSVERVKIVNISTFTRLWYSFAICEPLEWKMLSGVVYGVIETQIEK